MFVPSNGKKKYQCFVCGVNFDDYNEFKSHIETEHEKGREYISCSVCGAPIRDMRLHYQAKHPYVDMPKDGQMKATIWYDFSGKDKKRKRAKKPTFNEGYLVSEKNKGQTMHYRSGYELEIYNCLEELDEVVRYDVEPKDCVTPYHWMNRYRKYFPDLKVYFADGHIEVWEIKPAKQTGPEYEQNQAKWKACQEACLRKGYKFSVKTEKCINRLRRQLANQKRKRDI